MKAVLGGNLKYIDELNHQIITLECQRLSSKYTDQVWSTRLIFAQTFVTFMKDEVIVRLFFTIYDPMYNLRL